MTGDRLQKPVWECPALKHKPTKDWTKTTSIVTKTLFCLTSNVFHAALLKIKLLFSLCFLSYLLCSDMLGSRSPTFPSFRAGSEARDCDLPWGWVEDSFHPLKDALCLSISVFCIHLSLFSLLDPLTECRQSSRFRFPALLGTQINSAGGPLGSRLCAKCERKKLLLVVILILHTLVIVF